MSTLTREEIEAQYQESINVAWAEYLQAIGAAEAHLVHMAERAVEAASAERDRKLAELGAPDGR